MALFSPNLCDSSVPENVYQMDAGSPFEQSLCEEVEVAFYPSIVNNDYDSWVVDIDGLKDESINKIECKNEG